MSVTVFPYNSSRMDKSVSDILHSTTMVRVYILLLCFGVIGHNVTGNLISRTVENPDSITLSKDDNIVKNTVELPIDTDVAAKREAVSPKCAKIGEFCVSHSDCCSNACLGYTKKCVT